VALGKSRLLGGTPMRIERLADGIAALRVSLSPQALLIAASRGVDKMVAGGDSVCPGARKNE
jgi:hypothetical protein